MHQAINIFLAFLFLTLPGHSAVAANSHEEYLQGPFKNGSDVTKACIACHLDQATDFMKTSHWTWLLEQEILSIALIVTVIVAAWNGKDLVIKKIPCWIPIGLAANHEAKNSYGLKICIKLVLEKLSNIFFAIIQKKEDSNEN